MATPTRVVVIGAGWSGLVAAKTYLQLTKLLDRAIDLIVLDDSTDAGGVWSTDRLYPGLIANSPTGFYEFSDHTMIDAEHPQYQLIPGERVRLYLESYARKFGVYDRIRFGVKVVKVKRRFANTTPCGWTIETGTNGTFECDKLIIAAGLYSNPNMPPIPNSEYSGVAFHSRSLGTQHKLLSSDPSIKSIVVVGGCKSAVEAVSLFLPSTTTLGKTHHITWVIRPSDVGVPLLVQSPDAQPNLIAVNNTRLIGTLSPSIYNTTGFWYNLVHSGRWLLGRSLLKALWYGPTAAIRKAAKFDSSINGSRIKPKWDSIMYEVPFASLLAPDHPFLEWLHKDDFDVLEAVRATPVKLEGRQMVIRDETGKDTAIAADAVVWCTGWQPSTDFFDETEATSLGTPVPIPPASTKSALSAEATGEATTARTLPTIAQVDSEIYRLFPFLLSNPCPGRSSDPTAPSTSKFTPYRLYRQIIPASCFPSPSSSTSQTDHTIAFAGLVSNSQTSICSEITSLWAVAWLEDLISKSSLPKTSTEAEASIQRATAFQRLRYGDKGARDPEIILEVQSFLDVLCQDLGLRVERKKSGASSRWWWTRLAESLREYLVPYRASDYRGIVEEFVGVWRGRENIRDGR